MTLLSARIWAWIAGSIAALVCLPHAHGGAPAGLTGPGLTDMTGGGYWDGDLGVVLSCPGSATAWAMLGDVLAQPAARRTPNAVGLITDFR